MCVCGVCVCVCVLCCDPSKVRITSHHIARSVGSWSLFLSASVLCCRVCSVLCVCVYFVCVCLLASSELLKVYRACSITEPSKSGDRVVYIGGKDNYYFTGVLA